MRVGSVLDSRTRRRPQRRLSAGPGLPDDAFPILDNETLMIGEVISIGDEMTSGQRLDTNSQWLSHQLGLLGIRVLYHTTVGDDLAANVRVFREALDRADIIVATGGLGPTADDLTREALAQTLGRDLVRDETAEAHIRALFARRKREMPARNLIQAMFPAGSQLVPNPHGTAPGIDVSVERPSKEPARFFALPGVPAEMHEMWQQSVSPRIQSMLGDRRRILRLHTLSCFGVGESDLEAMLPDLIRRGRQPTVGITVNKATISLRIAAEGATEQECLQQIQATESAIRQCLGNLVFGTDEQELQDAVVEACATRHVTLATAEVGSGGLLAHWLSVADPERKTYLGGVIPRRRLARTEEATGKLAEEARALFGSDLGLALSEFPTPDAPGGKTGEVYVAMTGAQGTLTASYPFTGHPEILQPRAVKQALNFLRLLLTATPGV
jgi:nicotinamide-nucleotide amidase